jgi:hypothetical protein
MEQSVNPIIKALASMSRLLEKLDVPYMVFGGIANAIYGNPRQTFDIDIKFTLNTEDDIPKFLEELSKEGKIVPENPVIFMSETNVIPVDVHGVRVDLVRADLPFEREAIRRGRLMNFQGVNVRVCTAEDLIIQKAVSVRDKDWMDIHYIINNLRRDINWEYLLKHCKDLANFLEDPGVYDRILEWKNEREVSNASKKDGKIQ